MSSLKLHIGPSPNPMIARQGAPYPLSSTAIPVFDQRVSRSMRRDRHVTRTSAEGTPRMSALYLMSLYRTRDYDPRLFTNVCSPHEIESVHKG